MSHQHKLSVIYRSGGEGGMDVVRWCSECGAVVVDHDVDGRVYPGHVTAMRFPTMLDRAPASGAVRQNVCATCNGEGWVRDVHDMEQGLIRCTKCPATGEKGGAA